VSVYLISSFTLFGIELIYVTYIMINVAPFENSPPLSLDLLRFFFFQLLKYMIDVI
jgi:hypothetical protein